MIPLLPLLLSGLLSRCFACSPPRGGGLWNTNSPWFLLLIPQIHGGIFVEWWESGRFRFLFSCVSTESLNHSNTNIETARVGGSFAVSSLCTLLQGHQLGNTILAWDGEG